MRWVCCDDVYHLYRNSWLNGTLIAGFVSLFLQREVSLSTSRSSGWDPSKVAYLGTHFYPLVVAKSYLAIDQLYSISLNNYLNDILFTIHRPGHWFSSIVSYSKKTVYIIDGYNKNDPYTEVFDNLIHWFERALESIGIVPDPSRAWKRITFRTYKEHTTENVVLADQTDGSSCGVLSAMQHVYYIKLGHLPNSTEHFSQSDVPRLRLYMANLFREYNLEFPSAFTSRHTSDLSETEVYAEVERIEEEYRKREAEDIKIVEQIDKGRGASRDDAFSFL